MSARIVWPVQLEDNECHRGWAQDLVFEATNGLNISQRCPVISQFKELAIP